MNVEHRPEDHQIMSTWSRVILFLSASGVFLWLIFLTSCAAKPTDMRTLMPADSLIYLETNDLAAALRPIVEHQAFAKLAANKPDISHLNGVQLAVSVSGFEMSEERLNDEHSIGRVEPHFVAVAETHAWQFQTVRFAEHQLGSFVARIYGSEPTLDRSEKGGGHYLVWTAADGRKAFAVVSRSLIYFSNDESALEKSLAVKSGEADSIAKSGKVSPAAAETVASGYISSDGVAQVSSLASLSFASGIDGEPEIQSAVADILPRLMRGIVSEAKWTASTSAGGTKIVDTIVVSSPDEIGKVFNETLATAPANAAALLDLVPGDIPSVTLYNLAKPNVAWRSVLLTSTTLVSEVPGQIIGEFANAFGEPYAVRDPELFLSGSGPLIVTGNLDPAGDRPLVLANVLIPTNIRKSLDQELKPDKALSDEYAVEVLRTPDGELSAAFAEGIVIAGSADAVIACLRSRATHTTVGSRGPAIVNLLNTGAAASTLAVDKETAPGIASFLFQAQPEQVVFADGYTVGTRFTRTGIERRTTSDFGLVGYILTKLNGDL
jgi:hypothetical protein